MPSELWTAIFILLFAIVFFITEWLRVDIVALMVLLALTITGLLSPQEALAGFSNPVVITIAALFVIGGGILRTGLATRLGDQILRIAGTHPIRLTISVMLAVALLSSFMSDTGTVAVLLPAVIGLAVGAKISPSKLLMPLAFAALLGGASTLIGTPPNLVVSDLLAENGYYAFQFFDFTLLGLALLTGGFLFMACIGHRLLPARGETTSLPRIETPEELARRYKLPDNLFRLRVRPTSPLVGKSIAEGRFGSRFNVNIIELRRKPETRTMVKLGESRLVWQAERPRSLKPEAQTVFQPEDIILVQGASADVAHLAASWNLGVQPAEAEDEQALANQEVGLAEIILPPESSLPGKTIAEVRFGSRYHLTVLGIRRAGYDDLLPIKTTPLRFGDTILVQGAWQNILALREQGQDFIIIGQPESMLNIGSPRQAFVAGLILLGMLLGMAFDILPLPTLSLLAALLMILTRCVNIEEAYDFIDWKSIILIAGILPLGLALERAGLASLLAQGITTALGPFGPHWVLAGLFLITGLVTQVLTNTATAALLAPVGLAAAQSLHVQPHPFLMAVGIAASMGFATPIASPVNTLVMTAGRYRFKDYARLGLPLFVLVALISVLLIPLLWPFW
ncbi:MAG: SLC13 family permease [Anaerolineales bacterium]